MKEMNGLKFVNAKQYQIDYQFVTAYNRIDLSAKLKFWMEWKQIGKE